MKKYSNLIDDPKIQDNLRKLGERASAEQDKDQRDRLNERLAQLTDWASNVLVEKPD